MEPAREQHLMAAVARGDAAAYRSVSEHFLPRVLAYAARMLADPAEAEDVAQETCLRLWQRAGEWQPNARLSTWVFRIAHNQCIDRLRKRRDVGPAPLDHLSSGDRPSGLLQRKQIADAVQRALSQLPERQAAAVSLSHYEGLTNIEIAQVLELSVEAVESLLSRGRRSLRTELAALHAHTQGNAHDG